MNKREKPGPKVLVVDDDPDIGMMLKLMLEFKGYSVTVLEKGEEAIDTLKGNSIKMAIIDMLLSGMNGTDICRTIRQEPSIADCAVLMISAHPNAKEICMEAGADEFVAKPFDMNDILSKVDGLVGRPVKGV